MKDSFKGFFTLYALIKANCAEDENSQEVIQEFQSEYLKIGWDIVSSVNKLIILVTVAITAVFLSPEHPFYWRALTLWPVGFLLFCVGDKSFSKSKRVSEVLFISVMFMFGFAVIHGNLNKSKYEFYELWI